MPAILAVLALFAVVAVVVVAAGSSPDSGNWAEQSFSISASAIFLTVLALVIAWLFFFSWGPGGTGGSWRQRRGLLVSRRSRRLEAYHRG